MDRVTSMLERLPPLYRIEAGSVVNQLLALIGDALAVFDEDMDRVQRSHWVDTAFDREDLERIGALVGLPGSPWEPDDFYRARIKATVAARLRGSVTRAALELVLTRILAAAQTALGVRYLSLLPEGPGAPSVFRAQVGDFEDTPTFVEFSPERRRSPELVAASGLLRPLDRFVARNRGKDASPMEAVLRGVAGKRTAMPVLVNLSNGTLVAYAGLVRCGQELHLRVDGDGNLRGVLDGVDVTRRIYTSDAFVPGVPFAPIIPDPRPRPIRLDPGDNQIWYISLALYDFPGFDTAMLAMASPEMVQGDFVSAGATSPRSVFDAAVFAQPPAVVLDAFWDERLPATFRFEIPAGAVRRQAGRRADPEADHAHVFGLLSDTVDQLRAAAVVGKVVPRPLDDRQPATDRLTVLTADQRDDAGAGVDQLAAFGALFDVTALDESRAW